MEFFTVGDIANQGFYPVPEKLFNNRHYQKLVKKNKKVKTKGGMVNKEIAVMEEKLSDTSKLVYAVMCRHLTFSLSNGWFDEKKRVYIKLSVGTLAETLNKSRDTVVKCKKQLEEVGLLKIKKTQYQSDTFYLGKVKDRPEEDILMEVEDRRKKALEVDNIDYPKNLGIENIDQSKSSDKLVESIDSGLVESIDPNIVLLNRVEESSSTEAGNPATASESDFHEKLREIFAGFTLTNINTNTLKNIKKYSEGSIEVVAKAVKHMKDKGKPMKPNILVAILRDRDFEQREAGEPREIAREEKIEFMTQRLGQSEVDRLRTLILAEIGFECEAVDCQLGTNLCIKFNKYIDEGGTYV